jgi:hypothetical protein
MVLGPLAPGRLPESPPPVDFHPDLSGLLEEKSFTGRYLLRLKKSQKRCFF